MDSRQITNTLRLTAYHEAGHYVAKWALVGDAVYGDIITIEPDPESGSLGGCRPLEEDDETKEGIRAYIISLYAGATAECRASSDPEYVSEGSWSDDEKAGETLQLIPESEEELRNQTREIIDANWQVVERVADDLLKYRTLDADEAFFLADNDMESLGHYRQLKRQSQKSLNRKEPPGV